MNELVLIKSADFNGHTLDCYVELEQTDKGAFWATREQIGTLLGYAEPRIAIANIHSRNKERLDKFSRVVKLSTPKRGNQIDNPFGNIQEVTVYDFKGLLEICRYSNQPKANAIIDWLWEVAYEIRRTGSYSAKRSPSSFKHAKNIIDEAFKCKTSTGWQSVQALDKVFQGIYGYSVLEVTELQPKLQPAEPAGPSEELWQHIVSTFAPDEWFSFSALKRTLPRNTLSTRQIRRHLASFVARKMLCKRGLTKNSEYSRLKK